VPARVDVVVGARVPDAWARGEPALFGVRSSAPEPHARVPAAVPHRDSARDLPRRPALEWA